MKEAVDFVSLGMVILDEIHTSSQVLHDVTGGSGAFATMGYRLFAENKKSHRTGFLMKVGKGFPEAAMQQLDDWDTRFVKRYHDGPPTRGLLQYEDTTFGRKLAKKFKYTTTPLKLTPKDLVDTPLLRAKAFHILATPEEIKTQIPQLLDLRKSSGLVDRPLIVWEPFPASCKTDNRSAIFEACAYVDVFSPNHLELMALFGASGDAEHSKLLDYALTIPLSEVGEGCHTVITRAGEDGALVVVHDPARGGESSSWIRPIYSKGSPEVLDPTGAGNAFLGGFIAGFQETEGSVKDAANYGAVEASFALEQIGLPQRTSTSNGLEVWNQVNARERLHSFAARKR